MPRPSVTIYTDGGCLPNPGPGGWGVLLIAESGHTKELSGAAADTTNNRMELTAAVEALRALKEPCNIRFFTDSQYLKGGITRWLHTWAANCWLTVKDEPVKNQDLWQALHAETQRHDIDWQWVKGHAGDEHNERVDRLATAARERLTGSSPSTSAPASLPVDFKPDLEIALRVSVPESGGPGGWALRIVPIGGSMGGLFTGHEPTTTSNELELIAALEAVRQTPPGAALRVYCPGDYLHKGMTEWVHGWQQRGWKTASRKPVKNQELWQALVEETQERTIEWVLERDQPSSLAHDLSGLAADAVVES